MPNEIIDADPTPEANLGGEDACSDYRVELEDKVHELQAEVSRLRAVPFERGPDGEPNRPDLGAYDDLKKRADCLELVMGRLVHWTHVYGKALCPPGSDTYGEGMRDAKRQVSDIITGNMPPPLAEAVARSIVAQMETRARGRRELDGVMHEEMP
jgi:hypothetical protein